jgi:hypothetical protein
MGLSEFPDILSLVILPFGGDIGDGSLCDEIFSDPPPPFLLLYLKIKHLYLHSRHGLVMVDLLDNFLNPPKLFMALARDFTEWP